MGYLSPPPAPAPVVVVKDVGGLVSDYQAQTRIYRAEGREVRLMECRSACTLALSLPNVCVYPWSVLKFHTAYNQNTKEIDAGVSSELFNSYPEPVRARLGYLTRNYRNLSGEELIDLGIRDCRKGPDVQLARAQPKPAAPTAAPTVLADASQGSDPVSGLIRGVTSLFGGNAGQTVPAPNRPAQPTLVASVTPSLNIDLVPLPPRRPADLPAAQPDDENIAGDTGTTTPAEQNFEMAEAVPLPPHRPTVVAQASYTRPIELPAVITGAVPILPAGLSAYAPLPTLLQSLRR
ncbi:hypothetical protein PY365_08665 [Roseiarcaceae bacterium H3SJ34-1]|uniref:hypothetical protein n=1 Tax=Terripilifer ovatus TaxID=3032367 RepID=UPI003AB989E7|nr:hypothetical protein [Roseiarcaceae bacterium H3SJ34-1]